MGDSKPQNMEEYLKKIDALLKENEELRCEVNGLMSSCENNHAKLDIQNQKLKECVEYYANEPFEIVTYNFWGKEKVEDARYLGMKARQCLKEIKLI